MPLPYPEVFAKKSRQEDRRSALKKGVVAVVIVLNYLHLNRSKTAANLGLANQRRGKRQWEAVRRFEKFLKAWVEVSLVTPELMGRTAGKVESLENRLSELRERTISLAKPGQKYFAPQKEDFQPGQRKPMSEKVGTMEAGVGSAFKPVVASRLTFGGTPSFDPGPFLDPLSKLIFDDPCSLREDPRTCSKQPPKMRVHCSRSERIKLYELLDSSGRLEVCHIK